MIDENDMIKAYFVVDRDSTYVHTQKASIITIAVASASCMYTAFVQD